MYTLGAGSYLTVHCLSMRTLKAIKLELPLTKAVSYALFQRPRIHAQLQELALRQAGQLCPFINSQGSPLVQNGLDDLGAMLA